MDQDASSAPRQWAFGATRDGIAGLLYARNLALPSRQALLEAAGFEVKGEVKGCDIVAVRPGERPMLTIVEMKLGLTLNLLLQATDRMRVADDVWVGGAGDAARTRPGSPCASSLPVARAGADGRRCGAIASRCWRNPVRTDLGRISDAARGCSVSTPGALAIHRQAAHRANPS